MTTYLVIKGPNLLGTHATQPEADAQAAQAGTGARVLRLQDAVELLTQLGNGKTWHRITGGRNPHERETQAARLAQAARDVWTQRPARTAAHTHTTEWPIKGARVDGDTVVIKARGTAETANQAARQMCGQILKMKEASNG